MIRCICRELVAQGLGEARHYPDSRPDYTESAAVERAIAFSRATGAPIYIVHSILGGGAGRVPAGPGRRRSGLRRNAPAVSVSDARCLRAGRRCEVCRQPAVASDRRFGRDLERVMERRDPVSVQRSRAVEPETETRSRARRRLVPAGRRRSRDADADAVFRRRAGRPRLAEPVRGADVDEYREALRDVSSERDDRRRVRRRPGRLGRRRRAGRSTAPACIRRRATRSTMAARCAVAPRTRSAGAKSCSRTERSPPNAGGAAGFGATGR